MIKRYIMLYGHIVNQVDREGLISMPITTNNNERYECLYKDNYESRDTDDPDTNSYDGATPAQIIEDFSKKTSCSYRVRHFIQPLLLLYVIVDCVGHCCVGNISFYTKLKNPTSSYMYLFMVFGHKSK